MVTPNLLKYVRTQLEAGVIREAIVRALEELQWESTDIEAAFAEVERAGTKEVPELWPHLPPQDEGTLKGTLMPLAKQRSNEEHPPAPSVTTMHGHVSEAGFEHKPLAPVRRMTKRRSRKERVARIVMRGVAVFFLVVMLALGVFIKVRHDHDAARATDLLSLQPIMESYHAGVGVYPSYLGDLVPLYVTSTPRDRFTRLPYVYTPGADGHAYTVCARLESWLVLGMPSGGTTVDHKYCVSGQNQAVLPGQ